MRLTAHTDYALRVLLLLAVEPEQLHTIEEIAGRYDISRNHLMKVVHRLAQAGFISSQRGRSGGLSLQRPAREITLGSVVRATEEGFELVECFDAKHNQCVIAPACGLRAPLREALKAFLTVLDGYSLADVAGSPATQRRMLGLLRVEPAPRRPAANKSPQKGDR